MASPYSNGRLPDLGPREGGDLVSWKVFTWIVGGLIGAAAFFLSFHSHNNYITREEWQQYKESRKESDAAAMREREQIQQRLSDIESRLQREGTQTREVLGQVLLEMKRGR